MKDFNYGGKANSLIKLRDNGFNVPDFFIIDNSFYEKFLIDNDLTNEINDLISKKDYNSIKKLIIKASVSEEMVSFIYDKFASLNTDSVSVRSSASKEDGEDKSYAGQYNTFLNVSKNELIDKIKLCWCSLYEENVFLYGDEIDLSGMNVIVQVMIDADFAGVGFSVDPTSDTYNYSFIEMVNGVGEKLVSGECTPSKFLVRRETKCIDLKIGELNIDDKLVENLGSIILDIEKVYGKYVDVEFAIKNDEIFILQTRTITAITPVVKSFSLSITRPDNLLEQSIYFSGEYEGIKSVTRNLYYFKPLFVYSSVNKNSGIYYNEVDLEEDPRLMYYYMDLDYEDIVKRYEIIKDNIRYLNDVISGNTKIDVDDFVNKLVFIYPFASLGQLAGHFDNVSDRIRDLLFDFRNNFDYIIHKSSDFLFDYFCDSISNEYKDYAKFITLQEFISGDFPLLNVLKERSNGYIFYGEDVVTSNFDEWFKKNNIVIKEENDSSLSGTVIFGNEDVVGRVCKVFSEEDFSKFKKGDILVTPMTTPKFIKVMKEALAIVTDEGGVTCHAAIVAREFKIPCIVGCKNVTKVLNDGDEVKINMSLGTIISR